MHRLNWRNGDHGWRHAVRAEWTIPPLWYSRDTGSTTCVVKSSSVKPEQMTGSYELCILIDGVVKRYLTAIVDLKFWHPIILAWQSVVHGHTSPGHNCWQYTRCSWPRHRHKTTRCQIYITVYRRYTTEHRQTVSRDRPWNRLPRWMCPSNYVVSLFNYNRFSDRARYWSKIVIFL